MTVPADIAEQKKLIREQAHAARNAQPDKDDLSKAICDRFMALPEYAAAKTVLFYIDVRAEVRTRHSLPGGPGVRQDDRRPLVQRQGELELFHLRHGRAGGRHVQDPRTEARAADAGREAALGRRTSTW